LKPASLIFTIFSIRQLCDFSSLQKILILYSKNKKHMIFENHVLLIEYFMRWEGVEPSRPNGHMALNHACLPVPAPAQSKWYYNQQLPLVKKKYSAKIERLY